jgi:hypothetical protein
VSEVACLGVVPLGESVVEPSRYELPGANIPMLTGSHALLPVLGVSALLVGAPGAAAQAVEFQLLRYEDDLTTARAGAIDGRSSFKAIALGGATWLSLGGELRVRFERTSAPGLGAAGSDDEYGLHRALVHADQRGVWTRRLRG